jgi:hypothetical protein
MNIIKLQKYDSIEGSRKYGDVNRIQGDEYQSDHSTW